MKIYQFLFDKKLILVERFSVTGVRKAHMAISAL
jgi:hypothetical protein